MCGIAGYVGGYEPSLMRSMNALQSHRGPDGSGVWERPEHGVSLGHVRLAILDLSDSASQPMTSPDGRFVLTFNGEIYNFKELRHELCGRGHCFRSSGDSEVLLAGLAEWGEAFIERLNGIFSFALWDDHKRELILARDPMGIKPLYYTEPVPGTLLFASEIKALFAHPSLTPEPDFVALQQHLAFGHTSGDQTAFRGIQRLTPGSILKWSAATSSHRVQRFWNLEIGSREATDYRDATVQLRSTLDDATKRQLVSDVPTGTFLSGGLDSSLLTVIAASQTDQLDCFTTSNSSADNQLDQVAADLPHARRLAEEHGLRLHEIKMASDVADLLPKLIHHLDEPIADPAVIACYLISKLARDKGTRVLLSGQGADELLAGYPRYQAMQATAWLDQVPKNLR
ncbi:MAG TPA: asparagine synthase (glutamine-hydrolyzing), partial [Pirellulaceae bacterium]|nr:asparagine synthase (glutamine-hydrolyzing) [Pirellulaceae bacterium]